MSSSQFLSFDTEEAVAREFSDVKLTTLKIILGSLCSSLPRLRTRQDAYRHIFGLYPDLQEQVRVLVLQARQTPSTASSGFICRGQKRVLDDPTIHQVYQAKRKRSGEISDKTTFTSVFSVATSCSSGPTSKFLLPDFNGLPPEEKNFTFTSVFAASEQQPKRGSAGATESNLLMHTHYIPYAHKFPRKGKDQVVDDLIHNDFMNAPPIDARRRIVSTFTEKTSNYSLQTKICSVCARETTANDIISFPVTSIPNSAHLIPQDNHEAYDLFEGMLLQPEGLDDNNLKANICNECLTSLKSNRLPPLSLANGLWIGKLPSHLATMTLPERLLISKYFPNAFVFKLFPKYAGSSTWDRDRFYSGMKGNVSTYKLDPSLVAGMIEGNILPHPTRVLSALIALTFISPNNVPVKHLPGIFYVRRDIIREALLWYKARNFLYADVEISESRLQDLPSNGIPDSITQTSRISTDLAAVEREHEAYVPNEEETSSDTALNPDLIPVSSHGVIDAEGHQISQSDLFAAALGNSVSNRKDDDVFEHYAYRRGSAFINEYPRRRQHDGSRFSGTREDPNHLLGAFPTLFPYGKGGFEVDRRVDVSYEKHIKWALAYHDKRFRLDEQFPFVVFGICQKRQVFRSASLQVKRSFFIRNQDVFKRLKPSDFMKASLEEKAGREISDPNIKAIHRHIKAVRSRVEGTDENRISMRGKVWGTSLAISPPNVWITLNPPDYQDPIAQVFTGAKIDLDKFCNQSGPDSSERAIRLAKDPYAAANYFHFIINVLLETVFGIKKTRFGIQRQAGTLGIVQSYIATIEAQGRGTLHLHMLMWLKDAPTAQEMQLALQNEDFREKVRRFISDTVHADIDKKNDEEIRSIPKIPNISYSRPVNPNLDPKLSDTQLKFLARSLQLHACHPNTCLRLFRGRLQCKRGAPFALSKREWVNERGEWGPIRYCPFLNNWNDTLLLCLRGNHDIKLVMNGAETCVLTLYTTNYAFKKQNRSSNATALLAERLAFNNIGESDEDVMKINKRLLQCCANALFTEREFSSPEVMSYLAGLGDKVESHHHAIIYWEAALAALRSTFPHLRSSQPPRARQEGTQEDIHETLILQNDSVVLKDQLKDYQFRGRYLDNESFYGFVLSTYEDNLINFEDEERPTPLVTRKREHGLRKYAQTRKGRPRSHRVPYLEEAEKSTRCRVIRSIASETHPRIAGRWLPRNDRIDEQELYSAAMLLLFKPWRNLSNLKPPVESFYDAFQKWKPSLTNYEMNILDNIQYYYTCWDAANERKIAARQGKLIRIFDYERELANHVNINENQDDEEEEEEAQIPDYSCWVTPEITEENIEEARQNQKTRGDIRFAEQAMQIVSNTNIFPILLSSKPQKPLDQKAELDDMNLFAKWDKKLKETSRSQSNNSTCKPNRSNSTRKTSLKIEPFLNVIENSLTPLSTSQTLTHGISKKIMSRPLLHLLNTEQRRAHDIVENHFFGKPSQEQLLMIVNGQGGTGKSMLIDAITETFDFFKRLNELAKCATSGIAASRIGGMTIHSWAVLGIYRPRSEDWLVRASEKTLKDRRTNILGKSCLIIDEMSMLFDRLFSDLAKSVSFTKHKGKEGNPNLPFGGMNVILFGDFHQYPPVGNPKGALYSREQTSDLSALHGRNLYHQFTTVVTLEEQKRIQDPGWLSILQRLRVGQCTSQDLKEIRRLIITNPACPLTDFNSAPWNEVTLITTRHSVREAWNAAALTRHCQRTGNLLYVVPAEDTIKNATFLPNHVKLDIASLPPKKTKNLDAQLEIAKGMKAMVMFNVATQADIANGTRGVVEDIILDPREDIQVVRSDGRVKLKYPPAMIVFRPDVLDPSIDKLFRCEQFLGNRRLPKGTVPLSPTIISFPLHATDGFSYTIYRQQYALSAAYAFTDIKSQGQTMGPILVDISPPPTGKLSPFNAYVALSRSKGRDTIRLLRDFDDELFTKHPNIDLELETVRLSHLNDKTKLAHPQ